MLDHARDRPAKVSSTTRTGSAKLDEADAKSRFLSTAGGWCVFVALIPLLVKSANPSEQPVSTDFFCTDTYFYWEL